MNVQAKEFVYAPFLKDVMKNPLPYYEVLRRDYPVYYMEEYDAYVFSRFQDIIDLLSITSGNTFVASEQTLPMPEHMRNVRNTEAPPPPSMDPLPPFFTLPSPHIEALRQAQLRPLKPKSVLRMEDFVRKIANERLDALIPRKKFDLTQEYGGIVSASYMCSVFGIPASEAKGLLNLVNSLTIVDQEKGGVNLDKAYQGLTDFIHPWVIARRKAGADGSVPIIDDLISYRIGGEGGRALRDEEIASQLLAVLSGGVETVPKITAHGLLELSLRPDQLAEVRSDLARNVPIAVEEIIRYCAPAQWFARTVHKEATVAGQHLKPGQRVIALFGSAARDEREFDRPNEFIWNRKIARVLSFGFGQHFCIGVHVARMELRVMIQEFLRRVSKFEFVMEEAVRYPSSFQWGWNSLPVIVEGK